MLEMRDSGAMALLQRRYEIAIRSLYLPRFFVLTVYIMGASMHTMEGCMFLSGGGWGGVGWGRISAVVLLEGDGVNFVRWRFS